MGIRESYMDFKIFSFGNKFIFNQGEEWFELKQNMINTWRLHRNSYGAIEYKLEGCCVEIDKIEKDFDMREELIKAIYEDLK
jgi:hypothetical protein